MEKLTIKIDGREGDLDAPSFLTILRHTLAAVRELDRIASDGGESYDWLIGELKRVNPGFAGFLGKAKSESQPQVVSLLMEGVAAISRGDTRPRYFNNRVLANLRTAVATTGRKIDRIGLKNSSGSFFYADVSLVPKIDELLGPDSHVEYTELEGRLERLNVHGSRHEFAIYSRIRNKGLVCYFDPEDAERLGALIKSRVRVRGDTRYDREGRPTEIHVDEWEPMPPDDELPTLSDLHAMGFYVSGGKSVSEIVRELRGEH